MRDTSASPHSVSNTPAQYRWDRRPHYALSQVGGLLGKLDALGITLSLRRQRTAELLFARTHAAVHVRVALVQRREREPRERVLGTGFGELVRQCLELLVRSGDGIQARLHLRRELVPQLFQR